MQGAVVANRGRRRPGRASVGVLILSAVLLAVHRVLWRSSGSVFLGKPPTGQLPNLRSRASRQAEGSDAATSAPPAGAETAVDVKDDGTKSMLKSVGAGRIADYNVSVGGSKGGGLVWINRPGARSYEIRWSPGDIVMDLKDVIRAESGIPSEHQELQCNGNSLGPDDRELDDWIVDAGGITKMLSGKAPDVWCLDRRDELERDAANPQIVADEDWELSEWDILFKNVFYAVVGALSLYAFTQAIGLNPFEERGALFPAALKVLQNSATAAGTYTPPPSMQ